jgi:hypothetical protein
MAGRIPLRGWGYLPKGGDPGFAGAVLGLYDDVHPAGPSKAGLRGFSSREKEPDDLKPFFFSGW